MAKQKKESSKPAKEKKEKKARVVKRRAKRAEPKKQNSYHIIQSAISNYCLCRLDTPYIYKINKFLMFLRSYAAGTVTSIT